MTTIKIYKTNDGKRPLKIIGGNVSYTYEDDSKIFSVYTGGTWVCGFPQVVKVIITYQPDEVHAYKKWDNSKDQYGNKISESEEIGF